MMNKYSPNYNLKKIDIIIFKIHKYINIKFIYLFILLMDIILNYIVILYQKSLAQLGSPCQH